MISSSSSLRKFESAMVENRAKVCFMYLEQHPLSFKNRVAGVVEHDVNLSVLVVFHQSTIKTLSILSAFGAYCYAKQGWRRSGIGM